MKLKNKMKLLKQLKNDRELVLHHLEKHISRLTFLAHKYRDEPDENYHARLRKHEHLYQLLKQLLS